MAPRTKAAAESSAPEINISRIEHMREFASLILADLKDAAS